MATRKRTKSKRYPQKHKRSIPLLAVALPALILMVLVIGSFGYAANKEENDSFCASCHTQPESTFYQRELTNKKVDLATYHYGEGTKCIDCHSGEGIPGRVGAIFLGSRNAVAYFTRTAHQPAPLTVPIGDGNCVKCHQKSVNQQANIDNHFHVFLARWQAVDSNAAGCVSCHASHLENGDPQIAFLNQAQTDQVCQQCHNALGGGD